MGEANHLFFDCWFARYYWLHQGFENKLWQLAENWSINDRIWYILCEEDPKTVREVIGGDMNYLV